MAVQAVLTPSDTKRIEQVSLQGLRLKLGDPQRALINRNISIGDNGETFRSAPSLILEKSILFTTVSSDAYKYASYQ